MDDHRWQGRSVWPRANPSLKLTPRVAVFMVSMLLLFVIPSLWTIDRQKRIGLDAWADTVDAGEPVESPDIEVLGQFGGPVGAVALAPPYAYVGVGPRVLVLDISDMERPRVVGRSAIWRHEVRDIAIQGTRVYVAVGGDGLRVLDRVDPEHLVEVAVVPSPTQDFESGGAVAVVVDGARLFLLEAKAQGGEWGRLRAFNASEPPVLQELGATLLTEGWFWQLALASDRLFLGGSSLAFIDVSDPALRLDPVTVTSGQFVKGFAVMESGFLLTVGRPGLIVYDINDLQVREVARFLESTELQGIAIADNRGLVTARGFGESADRLLMLSLTDPAHPVEVGRCAVSGRAYQIAASGAVVAVVGYDTGLHLVDLADSVGPRQVGWFRTIADARAVDSAGDLAVVAAGNEGIWTVDVSQPDDPRPIAALGGLEETQGVRLKGTVAVVVAGMAGLQLIDVGDPKHPVEISRVATEGEARALWVEGRTAYVADGDAGLTIIDIGIPSKPRRLATLDTPGSAWDVAVAGSRAYVADQNGLQIIDVVDPSKPRKLGRLEVGSTVVGVDVQAELAWITDMNAGIGAVWVADASKPIELGWADTPGGAHDAVAAGSVAWVPDDIMGLRLFDIRQGSRPLDRGGMRLPGFTSGICLHRDHVIAAIRYGGVAVMRYRPATMPGTPEPSPSQAGLPSPSTPPAIHVASRLWLPLLSRRWPPDPVLRKVNQYGGALTAVAIDAGYAYVGWGPRILILDVTVPDAPRVIGSSADLGDMVHGLDLAGDRVVAAVGNAGIVVVDASDRASPVVIGKAALPDLAVASGIRVVGNVAYGVAIGLGLFTISLIDPKNPRLMGSYETFPPSLFQDVDVERNLAVLAGRSLVMVDVANPFAPRPVASVALSVVPMAVDLNGDRLYMVGGDAERSGLWIFAVEDAALRELGHLALGGKVSDIAVSGGRAYVADATGSLRVIDISDPQNPRESGRVEARNAGKVAIEGKLAVVIDPEGGMELIDVSQGDRPRRTGSHRVAGPMVTVGFAAGRAYVVDRAGTLRVMDTEAPPGSEVTGAVALGVSTYDLAEMDGALLVAAGEAGLLVVDIRDRDRPRLMATLKMTGEARAVVVQGRTAYLALGSGGIAMVDVTDPSQPVRFAGWSDGGDVVSVDVAGNWLFAADSNQGVRIVDISDTNANRLVATLKGVDALDGGSSKVLVRRGIAFVVCPRCWDALQVYDIGNPSRPERLGGARTTGGGLALDVHGAYAFEGDSDGLGVFDVSEPRIPHQIDYQRGTSVVDVRAVEGGRVFVAADSGGWLVYELDSGLPQ